MGFRIRHLSEWGLQTGAGSGGWPQKCVQNVGWSWNTKVPRCHLHGHITLFKAPSFWQPCPRLPAGLKNQGDVL